MAYAGDEPAEQAFVSVGHKKCNRDPMEFHVPDVIRYWSVGCCGPRK